MFVDWKIRVYFTPTDAVNRGLSTDEIGLKKLIFVLAASTNNYWSKGNGVNVIIKVRMTGSQLIPILYAGLVDLITVRNARSLQLIGVDYVGLFRVRLVFVRSVFD